MLKIFDRKLMSSCKLRDYIQKHAVITDIATRVVEEHLRS